MKLYECDICGAMHPWDWDGDCRDNSNRYADEEDYAKRNNVDVREIEVVLMDERVAADIGDDDAFDPNELN